MRWMRTGLAVTALLVAGVLVAVQPTKLIRIASGAVSQNLCSGVFVSGLEPDRVYGEEIRPESGMGLIAWATTYRVDRNARQVTTTVFGAFETTSVFREGFGCRVEYPAAVPLAAAKPLAEPPEMPASDIAGPDLVLPGDARLADALSKAFEPQEDGFTRHTRAIVIVHDGRIVAERYAPGVGIDTPLLSHSMAKSVLSALVGTLVRERKISANTTVALSAQRVPATVDQLLRMTSGLPLDEGIGPGLAQQMWFSEPDQAAFAERTPLATSPGTSWAYGNLGYSVLSRLVRDAARGAPSDVQAYARHELFAPLGMRHAFMEFDGAGSPMGGNAFFSSARDWARFGQLYLNDGVANGRRILPEGWVEYSTRQTLRSGYGAGFWLNVTNAPMEVWKARWGMPGVPRDAFFARGYLGQYVVVVPSARLVVVRLGVTHAPGGGIKGIGELVNTAINVLDR